MSRAGHRPLLEACVRVFEWNGTMLHAKTAFTDRRTLEPVEARIMGTAGVLLLALVVLKEGLGRVHAPVEWADA